jgi:hypothetical protein
MQTRSKRARRSKLTDVPIPAIPAGKGPFNVREMPPGFGASTNTLSPENTLYVPLGGDKESRAIRFHEYAHLELGKVRPKLAEYLDKAVKDKKQPIDRDWLQAGLDVVVNSMAQKRNIEEISDLPLDDPKPTTPEYAQAMWLLRKLSLTNGKVPRNNMLPKDETTTVQNVYTSLQNLGHNYTHRQDQLNDEQYAKYVAAALRNLQSFYDTKEAISKLKMSPSIAPMTNMMLRQALGGEGLSRVKLTKMLGKESPFDITHKGPAAHYRYGSGTDSGWGTMSIVTLTMDAMARRRAPERKPSYVGGFRNAFRALLPAMDGRAWAIRRKKMGGTILLDMSGSMSLEPEDIVKLLKTAPLAQIAGYSGSKTDGTMYIMAKGGRYHNGIPRHPGSNVIDGPALRWLSEQPKPRVWISDGQVTGTCDGMQTHLLADAIGIVSRGDIERYHTIDAYLLGQPGDDTPYEE